MPIDLPVLAALLDDAEERLSHTVGMAHSFPLLQDPQYRLFLGDLTNHLLLLRQLSRLVDLARTDGPVEQ
jgi:hypothetical protein